MIAQRPTQDMPAPGKRLDPTARGERIVEIDILRGLAILGILLVNMAVFSAPLMFMLAHRDLFPGFADQVAEYGIRFFAESKFYSLFSFLFGLGFALQMQRADSRGVSGGRFFARRLMILLIIGVFHAHVLWNGDILTIYALIGFVLLLFRNRSPKTLIIWALILIHIPVVLAGLFAVFGLVARNVPEVGAEFDKTMDLQRATFVQMGEEALEVYANGSFGEIYAVRIKELLVLYKWMIFGMCPNVLAMFLFGLYAGRRRIFAHIDEEMPFIKRLCFWGLLIGVLGNAVYTYAMYRDGPMNPTPLLFAGSVGVAYGAPAMCFFYAGSILWLTRNPQWKARLLPLAAVGRLALSNYLLQTLICTTIFYSYGLGMFGKVGTAAGLALTLFIYGLQIILSRWWLKRFRFGPAEWLWRCLSYGHWQPMRRPIPQAAPR